MTLLVKYLGLMTLRDILEADRTQITAYKQYVVQCFNSEDPSIKSRALEIIKVTTSRENLEGLVAEMIRTLPGFKDPAFQRNVMQTVIDVCSCQNYKNVVDFGWLTSEVLFRLAEYMVKFD